MLDVTEYVSADGVSRFAKWFSSLDAHAAARVTTAIERMRLGNLGDHKSVGDGVLERRIDYGPGYRVYFGRDGDRLVVLLCGGAKSRQSADIAAAKKLWAAYRAEKKKG